MLPPFATAAGFQGRLGRPFRDEDERSRAEAALDDASAIIRAWADGTTWVTDGALDADLPDAIVAITYAVARRVFDNPDAVTQSSIGPYSETIDNASADVYLKKSEKELISRLTRTTGGIGTLATTRGALETPDVCEPDFCDLGLEFE